ncbi:MAG: glycosyltransferase family 4 protein [Bacteroidota bacterium]|nr:glycosyltransferase family 4 protein [Bacteroidota bacterium]
MRVLFLSLDALEGVGGIQRFNRRLIRALGELAAEGLVEQAESLSLWDALERHSPYQKIWHRGFGRRKPAFVAAAAWTFLRYQPDVVLWGHVLLLPLLPLAELLCPKAVHVLLVHGVEVWGDPRYRRAPRWEKALVKRLNAIFSVSQTTADYMAQAYGVTKDRFFILPNAIDLCCELRKKQNNQMSEIRILSVTRIQRDTYKGLDIILLALSRISSQMSVRCVVVGDGELRGYYEDMANKLGISDIVKFVGKVEDLALDYWYNWADIFILPSVGEGFGIVYLEAWAHGLPVVGAKAGGAAEIIKHGQTGLLIEPGSVDGLSEAILTLARDPELRKSLGQAGRALVEAQYTHEHFRNRLAGLLKAITNAKTCAA